MLRMKNRIVSLLLTGVVISNVTLTAFAEEMDEVSVSEAVIETQFSPESLVTNTKTSTNNTIIDSTVNETQRTETTTEIINNETIESKDPNLDTTVSETTNEPEIFENENASTDNKENESDNIIDNEDKIVEAEDKVIEKKEPIVGDQTFEIKTNEDGTQTRITYEYQIDEETGELILVEIESIDGLFDEDGNLIEAEEEDTEEDETIGKVIGLSGLGTVTFDHKPTADEIKASLPASIGATIKGETKNIETSFAITFNEADIEAIVNAVPDNEEVDLTFSLIPTVTNAIEIAEGVEIPSLEVRIICDAALEYQTLIDETSGIAVEGMLPKDASISVETIDNEEFAATITDTNNIFYENPDAYDSFDFLFMDSSYRIIITDPKGNEYVPKYELLVTKKITDENVTKIGSNQFTVTENGVEVLNSFNAATKELSYLTSDLSNTLISGTNTVNYVLIRFEVLSTNNDFEFSSVSKLEIGAEIVVPEFYTSDETIGSALSDIDWSDVDSVATASVTYTKYIDSSDYIIERGNDIEVVEAASYGDVLTATNTKESEEEVEEATDTKDIKTTVTIEDAIKPDEITDDSEMRAGDMVSEESSDETTTTEIEDTVIDSGTTEEILDIKLTEPINLGDMIVTFDNNLETEAGNVGSETNN